MKKAFLLLVLLCGGLSLWAQKVYFVYIQSDTHTPFYVKMGDKVSSSTASGYLILSRLKDSTYKIQLGPSAADGELQFSITINQNDRGFLLKKFPEGWGLFDLQSLQILMPVDKRSSFSGGVRSRDDRFTTLLARAADDTTLFYQPISVAVAPAPKKAETAKTPPPVIAEKQDVKDTIAAPVLAAAVPDIKETAIDNPSVITAVISEEVAVAPAQDTAKKVSQRPDVITAIVDADTFSVEATEFRRSKIVRRAESSTVDGFGLVFWDDVDGVVDTIRVFIPNQKIVFVEPESLTAPQPDTLKAVAEVPVEKAIKPATCNGVASQKDFFRIRTSLVSFESEKDMVAEAKSSFKKKCFSTEQIKSLSSLFLTQEGKWEFLEASYPNVSDKDKFASLQSELFEETYISRFKALVAK